MYTNLKIIAFDADDTLFINEDYLEEAIFEYEILLSRFGVQDISSTLTNTYINNLPSYGFGIKGIVLTMIEVAARVGSYGSSDDVISEILNIGKKLLSRKAELLPNVFSVLNELKSRYKLVVATKGDLKDQKRKLRETGLLDYFDHVEVMTDKNEYDYKTLLGLFSVEPSQFLMVGNSLRSDIEPVLNIGAHAVHIPYHKTWEYESVADGKEARNYIKLKSFEDLLTIL